ncbi:hypothetical protein ThvES_00008790 [Thiovulum sp. ES]|nr:hypothetical protein ThvES_00008790 [Thiovulum sp. ES]
MEDLKTIKELIKSEIVKTKDELLRSNDRRAVRFFLNSVNDDILEMIKEGFNYKEQLTIINKSSQKNISYNTYIRYVKECVLKNGATSNGYSVQTQSSGKRDPKNREDRERERDFGFTHEAVPDKEELY